MALARRQQQVSLLHAASRVRFDDALRATEPAARLTRLAACEQPKTVPKGCARGGQVAAGFQMRAVHALLRRQHLVVARSESRRPREPLQIFDAERRRLIRE